VQRLLGKKEYGHNCKGGTTMTEQNQTEQPVTNWLDEEANALNISIEIGERLPSLKLEQNKIVTFTVDFTNPFVKWTSEEGVNKAIIPVTHDGVKKNLWLNVKNPLYGQIIEAGKRGQSIFRVFTTGTQKDTRYALIADDTKNNTLI